MIANWYGKDKLNLRGQRTVNNTNRLDFNCGGYALETYNWYLPVAKQEQGEKMFGWCRSMALEEVLDKTVKHMLKEFKGKLRVIKDVAELQEGEYAIAYCVGEEDFHYIKRHDSGHWLHKTGRNPRIKRMTKKDVFSGMWCDGMYHSEVVLFAKKRV